MKALLFSAAVGVPVITPAVALTATLPVNLSIIGAFRRSRRRHQWCRFLPVYPSTVLGSRFWALLVGGARVQLHKVERDNPLALQSFSF